MQMAQTVAEAQAKDRWERDDLRPADNYGAFRIFRRTLPGGRELLYRRGGGNGATIVTAIGVRGLVEAFNAGV